MQPGYIATLEDYTRYNLPYRENSLIIKNRLYFQFVNSIYNIPRYLERYQAFPIITCFTYQEKNNYADWCTNTNSFYHSYAHIVDDIFHWYTDYEHLPNIPTNEDLLIRLNNPKLAFAWTTQLLVNNWAQDKSFKQVFKLINSGIEKWYKRTDGPSWAFAPSRKWKTYYKNNPSPDTYSRQEVEQWIERHYLPQFLHNYNEKATTHFDFKIGKQPKYSTIFGIELELENLEEKNKTVLKNTLSNHCIFKRDGSLSNGVEICSAPATLDIHKQEFKTFFETKHSLKALPSCGLHVHVDKKSLGNLQLAKLTMFMNHPDNSPKIEKLAGRAANSYCQVNAVDWESFITPYKTNKYQRINTAPENTVEFRLFAATTDFTLFLSRLEFVQAIIDYTKTGETPYSVKDSLIWSNFVSYVNKKQHFYPTLTKALGAL